jgi:signal transduction histidine kinase
VKYSAAAASAWTRQATRPAWRALAQVAAGRDPAPACRWRSPRQRRAVCWAVAVATLAAGAASVAWLLSARATLVPLPGTASQGRLLNENPGLATGLDWRSLTTHLGGEPVTLAILAALAGVVPMPLVIRRPLLGWRIACLALLAVPWAGIHWRPGGLVFAAWPWNPAQAAVLAALFAAAGIRHPRGVLWWMWALTLLAWWLQGWQARVSPGTLAVGTVVFTAVAVAADALRERWRSRLALAAAAEQAEAEAARRAVLEERARIARELHDVVAHHMSLIAVRAESAPYRLSRLAVDARAEFSELSSAARSAMTDMQRLLGVLRTAEAPARVPQPRLLDLPRLIEAARQAGLGVELSQTGSPDTLPAAVGVCAYRVIQESLSNAGRHAPGAAVSVAVVVEPEAVRLTIRNGPPSATGQWPAAINGHRPGHGLAGMRERVMLLGGTFAAGPAGGGFEVAAELPARVPA